MTHSCLTPGLFSRWHRWLGAATVCAAAVWLAAPVQASAPTEKVFCTDAPRAQWMSEAQARERFRAQDYVLVKHKISSGHCHEFYAVDAQGTVVESYLHPITGEVVRTTRVPAPPPPPNKP